MRIGGYVEIARVYLAVGLRKLIAVPVWCGDLIAVAADCADPAMPESIRRPSEWLPRLWARGGHADPARTRPPPA